MGLISFTTSRCFIKAVFKNQVTVLTDVFLEFRNPFSNTTEDLLELDTSGVMPKDVIVTVHTIKDTGKNPYKTYVKE